MDIFSRMLSLAGDLNTIKGISVSRRSMSISHLFFADDALLFFKTSHVYCQNIMEVSYRFCLISGSQINLAKSFVKFSPNIPFTAITNYNSILKMDYSFSIGVHIGVPIDIQGPKTIHFNGLIDYSIQKKLLDWDSFCLSKSIKIVLINTVLVAMILIF